MPRLSKILPASLAGLLLPFMAAAQDVGVSIPQPLGDVSLSGIVGKIINNMLGVVGSIAFVIFIYGGFLYLTSSGNEDQVEKGKKTITYAALGLLVVFFAYAIVNFVVSGIGVATQKVEVGSCTGGQVLRTQPDGSEKCVNP